MFTQGGEQVHPAYSLPWWLSGEFFEYLAMCDVFLPDAPLLSSKRMWRQNSDYGISSRRSFVLVIPTGIMCPLN